MLWGIVVGTYSSIFVAVPLVLYLPVIRPEEPLEGEVQRG
jgi:preprotein translocase subunit SecF